MALPMKGSAPFHVVASTSACPARSFERCLSVSLFRAPRPGSGRVKPGKKRPAVLAMPPPRTCGPARRDLASPAAFSPSKGGELHLCSPEEVSGRMDSERTARAANATEKAANRGDRGALRRHVRVDLERVARAATAARGRGRPMCLYDVRYAIHSTDELRVALVLQTPQVSLQQNQRCGKTPGSCRRRSAARCLQATLQTLGCRCRP